MKIKNLTLYCVFLTYTLFISLPVKAISYDVNQNKDYPASLNKLCYTNLSEEFNEFSNTLSKVNVQQYKVKIKQLGIDKRGKRIDYTIAIPMADIMTTSDKLRSAIKELNQSLIKLNTIRKACSDELDEYRFRD
jgi:hypothetical protein